MLIRRCIMKNFCFIILPTIIAISILQGFTDKTSLSLTANTIQMDKGAEYNININGKRPGLTYHWTSSDDNVVEVNSKNGIIKAMNYGEALIHCLITDTNGENVNLSSKVTVGVDELSPQLKVNKFDLKPEDEFDINIARKIINSKYKWTSSNKEVIRVKASNGFVTAVGFGEAKVTCTITAPDKHLIVLSATINVRDGSSNIIWEDDFNLEILDSNKWGYEYGYVRNFEMQDYTDRVENAFLRDGHLVLKALKDENGAWTSASVHTNNKLEIGNARIEARIKLPYESGAFPAFWMLGADYEVDYSIQRTRGDSWPEAREIDIIETFGKVSKVQGGVYFIANPNDRYLTQHSAKSNDIDISQFHTYAVEKSDKTIKFYYDNNLYYTHVITDDGLKEPFYILLNLAVGASGGIPDPDISEMEMMVDYVRVTALEGVPVTQVEAITLDINEFRGNIGDVKKVNARLLPLAAQDRTITWISSDPTIATVYGGYVRLLKEGTCTISAISANGITRTLKVICN
ncbi:MAG: glycosyl hydrolase family protein [Anaerolineaceae bacterium]|nr:MAG: glycosyl hydrolase family protein [Anaerolineaceae bacterium]